MRTVYKYTLDLANRVSIELPKGAEILHFNNQNENPTIWCLVEPNEKTEERKFRLTGTGHPIEENNLKYIDTAYFKDGALVFHLFEELS